MWLELLLRAAAVYVIVLMLPLAFAALVWPARRIWAVRAVEVLVALILSKFLIVAVLSLGGAALSESSLTSVSGMLAAFVLLAMGTLAPWALLRLLPLGELAAGAVGSLRGEATGSTGRLLALADGVAGGGHEWAATTAEMRRQAEDAAGTAALADAPGAPVERPPEAVIGGASPSAGDGGTNGSGPSTGAPTDRAGSEPGTATASESEPVAASDAADARERSPGLDPIWQMDDFSWPALTLGLDDGWPPPPIGETPDRGASAPPPAADRATPSTATDGTSADADRDVHTSPHELHDPTPPPQSPEAGSQ